MKNAFFFDFFLRVGRYMSYPLLYLCSEFKKHARL